MAALTRSTWANLATEFTRRVKGIDYTGFDARAQRFLWHGYLWISTTYGNFELDKIVTGTLSTSTNEITSLPTDLWIILGLQIKAVAAPNAPLGGLTQKDVHPLFAEYRAETARPKEYARFGAKIYLDKISDAAYPYQLFYRALPAYPDFAASATPETTEDVDEAIIAVALALAEGNLSMFEAAGMQQALHGAWTQQQVRPATAGKDLPDRPLSPRANQSHQGDQG